MTRDAAGIALLVGAALLSAAGYAVAQYRRFPSGSADRALMQRQAERFAGVRPYVPRGAVLAYLSDHPRPPREAGGVGVAAFFLAQYAMAPVVLDAWGPHPLALGNFVAPGADPRVAAPADWELTQDFGQGVALFRRRSE